MATNDFFSIDIGRKSIKLVKCQLEKEGLAKLEAIASIDFPPNLESVVPSKDNPEKVQLLASIIKSLVVSSGVNETQVVAALPESVVFSKFISLPLVDSSKLEETVFWEARQFIPIPIDDAQMDWIEVRRNEPQKGAKTIDLIIIAAPRTIVEDYLNLFNTAELELIALEVESVATARAVAFNYSGAKGNNMIIDFGFEKTNVSIVYDGKLVFTQSIPNGSNALSKAIAADFGLQMNQADQYKHVYGLLSNKPDAGKIANSIKPVTDLISVEIKKIIGFVNTRLQFGQIQKAYITGGGSLLPGLPVYLKSILGMEVQIVDPFSKIQLSGKYKNLLKEIPVPSFSLAVGLSIKNE